MRNYFIDYFQLWFPIDRDSVYDPNVKAEIIENISNNLFNNKIKKRLIKIPNLSLNSFFHMHFHHGGLIFHLKGNYFDSDKFSENLDQVFNTIEVIYNDHKSDFDFTKATLSRIDLACNLPFFLNTNPFKIKKAHTHCNAIF